MANPAPVRECEAMTDANVGHEPTEVLDLYDVLPETDRPPARTEMIL